jgi:uncharacterized membrane protein
MNSEKSIYFSPLAILFMILALFTAFLTSVALNIMVARQALGFLYLTFIPGFLVLTIECQVSFAISFLRKKSGYKPETAHSFK